MFRARTGYTNWGSRHAPSAIDNSTGQVVTLAELSIDGHSQYNPLVGPPDSTGQPEPWHSTNEDGNWVYAGLEGPLASQRLELWRIGMEDLALLQLLGPTEAQALAQTMVRSGIDYTFNATLLEEVRARAVASLVAQHHRCMIPEKNDGSPPLTTLRTLKSDDVAIPAIVTVAATA